MKPTLRPTRPLFSSGPCAKRPGWTSNVLDNALAGRSHRSPQGQARLNEILIRSRRLLRLPDDYRIGIVPGSDTGAVEIALWCLLGARDVDLLAWESFGSAWVTDVLDELKLRNTRVLEAEYGMLPDLTRVDWTHDVVFTWNGTTSGVRVPNGNWIADDRQGLAICDATSAVFAMDLPWRKLDATTWSWQKVLGGEAAHGMLVLSPRAVARLENHTTQWPLPKLFRLTKKGRLVEDVFAGATINTPSMLCAEDQLDALRWAESIGGLNGLIARCETNLATLTRWVAITPWVEFLARQPETRSCTSVCLRITDPWFNRLTTDVQWKMIKQLCALLESEDAAYDIAAYRDAPPGLRIWCGATVEQSDLERLTPWIDWAFDEVKRAS